MQRARVITAYILGVDVATRVGVAAKGLMHTAVFTRPASPATSAACSPRASFSA